MGGVFLPRGIYEAELVLTEESFHGAGLAGGWAAAMGGTVNFALAVPGDASLDDYVDGADYTLWADHYKTSGGWGQGDFNGDGWIDGADYTIWADHYAPPGAGALTPEPAYAFLLTAGCARLLIRRRGWRNAS